MIIHDDVCLLNTQGVRFAEKIDASYGGSDITYRLRVTYKGDVLDVKYPSENRRDIMWRRFTTAMESGGGSEEPDQSWDQT